MDGRSALPALVVLDAARRSFQLELVDPDTSGPLVLGDDGAAALGASLQALPTPLTLSAIHLNGCELSPAGMAALTDGLARCLIATGGADELRIVSLNDNPGLGEAGLAALLGAVALHAGSLEDLHRTHCGPAAMHAATQIAATTHVCAHLYQE